MNTEEVLVPDKFPALFDASLDQPVVAI